MQEGTRIVSRLGLLTLGLAVAGCPKTANTPDSAPNGQSGQGCVQILACNNNCDDQTCADACVAEGSGYAQQLFQGLDTCIITACSEAASGVCATDTSDCETCIAQAQSTGGACVEQLSECEANTSGTSTSTGTVGCGGITNCADNCASDDTSCQQACVAQGTATGQEIFGNLNECFAGACSQAASGVCGTDTAACSTCILDAEALAGACNQEQIACDGDMSGSGSETGSSTNSGCVALNSCLETCEASDFTCQNVCLVQSTSQAIQDLGNLDDCFETACPETNGGPCSTDSTACSVCLMGAQTGTCSTQYQACSKD